MTDNLNRDNVPEDAWDQPEKVDMATGTNRYLQIKMTDALSTVSSEITRAQENDEPFNTLVVLLTRNGQTPDDDAEYEGLERYFTQVGNRDYAIDASVQFAIEASNEILDELMANNPDMTATQHRQLQKGMGFNIIKRVIDEFDLTDEDIDLNELKGPLSDVVSLTDDKGNYVDFE